MELSRYHKAHSQAVIFWGCHQNMSVRVFTGMSVPTQKVFSRFLSVILKILAILGLFTKSNVFDKGIIEFPPKYRIKID